MSNWSAPQWIMAGILGLQIFSAVVLHGKPRKSAEYDGSDMAVSAGLVIIVLCWGGFFK